MVKIVANLSDLETLAERVVPVLRSFSTSRQTAMFDDFALNDVHNALVMFKAVECYENPDAIKHILKSPIHGSGIKGAITKSLHKLGISGVTANFHEVLDDFHRFFLASEELRPELLPKGFVLVNFNSDHKQEMLEKDEFRNAEMKRKINRTAQRGKAAGMQV